VITITDATAPVISNCPVNITLNNDTGNCGAVVTWINPTVTDNCGLLSFVSTHNSGDQFPVGTTLITYTATDLCNNVTTCSFNITVNDTENPSITCPSDISQPADIGLSTASVAVPDAVISDNCSLTSLVWLMTGATTATSPVVGINQIGTYIFNKGVTSVTYTLNDDAGNTSSCTFAVTITQSSLPLSGSITSQKDVDCFGTASGSVTVTGIGGLIPYEYSFDGITYQPSGTFGSLSAGSYTITVIDAAVNTTTVNVAISGPASALGGTATFPANILCFGGNTGSVTINGSGGVAPYQYKLGTGSYQVSGTFSSLTAGTYTITVQDANGCHFDVSVTLTEPAAALAGTIISQSNVLCSGASNASVSIDGSGGTGPYQYSLNGAPFQLTGVYSGLTAGNYTIEIQDANICTAIVPVNITEPAVLSVASSTNNSTCPGEADGSITLTITGGTQPYNVLWSDGILTASRTNVADGTYSTVITDANGCATSKDIVVNYTGSETCIEIPQIITPNNDGFNDTWKIKNIDLFPNAEVLVFTRWGKLVYRSTNPLANPWDGTYKRKLLPTDSYHYILDLHNGSNQKSGVISIIR